MPGLDAGEYLASLPGYVVRATYFILSGTEDMRQYWLMNDADQYRRFKEARQMRDETVLRFARWQIARWENHEDPLDITAFAYHIEDTEGDPTKLWQYGCPLGG